MARRTKAEKFDIEVEVALEKALDFDFDDDNALDTKRFSPEVEGSPHDHKLQDQDGIELLDLESLEQQIAMAAEELSNQTAVPAAVVPARPAGTDGKKKNASSAQKAKPAAAENRAADITESQLEEVVSSDNDAPAPAEPVFAEPPLVSDEATAEVEDTIVEFDDTSNTEQETKPVRLSPVAENPRPENPFPPVLPTMTKAAAKNARRKKTRIFLKDPLYWGTTLLSASWAISGIAIAYRFFPASFETVGSFLSSAQGVLFAAAVIVPILMFWGFAQLAKRSRELQQVVHTMTGATIRLLEPDTSSKNQVASLGHSIRREVAAMGEGIDRTMSRAGELEALLQSEVYNLEQAYSENETRIRTLIVELANEREAVSTHADHVKTTITGAKDQLTQEFNSIADHINATAESFTSTLSETLNARWGELVNEFNMANEDVAKQLSRKFVETVGSFDASRGRFFEELDNRFAQIDQHTEEASKALAGRLGTKMDDFVKIVQERTEDVEGRFNTLTGRLANNGEKIIEAVDQSVAEIEKRSDNIDQRLRSAADRVLSDFDAKFQKLDDTIVDRGNLSLAEFSEQIEKLENRARDLPLSFDGITEKTIDEVSRQIGRIEEQFNGFSGQLSENGTALAQRLSDSLNQIEQRSDNIDARLNAAAEKILSEFEIKFDRLDRNFADRSNTSLDTFATQISKLEQQSLDLSSNFDNATNLAVQAFEKRLNQVDDSLNERSTSLIRSFIARTDALEESTDKLNVALETHVNRINEAFQLRTRDIAHTLTDGRDGILSIIDETKIRLSHEMEIVGTTIGNLVDERAGGFIHKFIEGREKLSDTLQTETSRILDTVETQISTLSRHVSDMEDILSSRMSTLDEAARGHIHALDERTSAFEENVARNFDTARTAIETQAQNIDKRAEALRDSLSLNSETLAQVLGEQAAVLEERIARIREMITQGNTSLAGLLDKHTSVITESVSSNDEILKETFLEHLKNLEGQTARLKNAFHDNQQSLFQSLDSQIISFRDSLANNQMAVESVLSNHGQLVSDRAVELQNSLVQTFSTIDEKLDYQGKMLDKRAFDLRDTVDHNNTLLTDSFLRQTAVIDERTKTMQKAIEIGVNNVKSVLERNASTLSETLRDRISEVSGTMTAETSRAESAIASAASQLTDSVMQAVNDADEKFASRGEILRNNIHQAGEEIGNGLSNIEMRLVSTTSSLTQEAEKAESILFTAGNRLSGSVTRVAEEVEKKFLERGIALHNNVQTIENQISASLEMIESRMSGAATNLTEEAHKAETVISSAGIQLAETVIGAAQNVEEKLSSRSHFLKENLLQIEDVVNNGINSIEGRISEITQNAAGHLLNETRNLHSLTEQLQTAAAKTSESLGTLTNQFNDQLKEVTRAAEERLRAENNTFINNFSSQAGEAVAAVRSAKSEIEANVAHLLERLDVSSGTIKHTVYDLNEKINEADIRLNSVTSEFKQNIGKLAEDLTSSSNGLSDDLQRFTNLSQNALGGILKFSEQFENHATLLSEAALILDNSNAAFGDKLEINQETLNTLASGLVDKSDEIANVMQNCEQIISAIISRTEEQARSSTIQLQTSLADMISEASSRFDGATAEIRRSAEEIRDEFVKTRTDLNRGVRTLPSQTKEYTDAMRKAVIEQIEALKELSGIIEESGRVYDLAQPVAVGAATASLSPSSAWPQRHAASVTVEKPVQNPGQVFAPVAAGADAIKMPVVEPVAASAMNGAAVAETVREEVENTARSAATLSSTPPASKMPSSRGWVSDLLARASRNDLDRTVKPGTPVQSTENPVETLNSLSPDIVQSIDRNAIIQLWQHYRRGQRNISPNHLYTSEGHLTFEKIKHKYALDGEFRRAVSQYIIDFERLLGDVTKNGGNNDTVREYLTSDTGKVYTMLAHVSGRIQ